MNNRYTKIDSDCKRKTHKSRSSMDFSDSFTFPQTPKLSRNTSRIAEEEPNQMKKTKTQDCSSSPDEREDYEGGNYNGERLGVILGRSGSVSSSMASSGFVKRAFSIRRSSSVSERYCRIHDQNLALASPVRDDGTGEDEIGTRRSMKKKKQRAGNILRACKRLMGLQVLGAHVSARLPPGCE